MSTYIKMSILKYFSKTRALPSVEESQIGEKATAESNKRVAEVIEQHQSNDIIVCFLVISSHEFNHINLHFASNCMNLTQHEFHDLRYTHLRNSTFCK